MPVTVTLDQRTLDTLTAALRSSGDDGGLSHAFAEGENVLEEAKARQLWFTIRILTDLQGTSLDAKEGSPESYFGVLREHQPALDLLQSLVDQGASPSVDLITPLMEREPVGDA